MIKKGILTILTVGLLLVSTKSLSVHASGYAECEVPGCIPTNLYLAGNDGSISENPLGYSTIIDVGSKGELNSYVFSWSEHIISVCEHGTYAFPCHIGLLSNYDPNCIGLPQIVTVNHHNAKLQIKVVNCLLPIDFLDVNSEDWYYDSVGYLQRRGIMTGLDETHFGPAEPLHREQFAVALYRMAGEPYVEGDNIFKDVDENSWYGAAVCWANQTGIITGYGDTGLFGIGDLVTREQAATMLFRFANYKGYDTSQRQSLNIFPDGNAVAEFARTSMEWAIGANIISGDQGCINPQSSLSRAQMATVLTRFMKMYIN